MVKADLAETIRKRMAQMGRRIELNARSPFAKRVREMDFNDLVALTQHALGSPDNVFKAEAEKAGLWNA